MEDISEIRNVLTYIGFNTEAQLDLIEAEFDGDLGLGGLAQLDEKSVKAFVDDFKSRGGGGKIHFGVLRTQRLKASIAWAKDCFRIGEVPSTQGMNQEEFLEAINVSAQREAIREASQDQNEQLAKEAAPGKLTSEKKWHEWSTMLDNQLSMLLGVNKVPLSYVIRENEVPDPDDEYMDFQEECIAKCPLAGPVFEQDARTVHRIIASHTTGENAEQWIKTVKKHRNGRLDMIELRRHFKGTGNQTRRIADAERMEKTLHYKDERAMSFANFLSKLQTMFNIFEEVGEPKTDAAQLRYLLDKISNSQMETAVNTVRTAVAAAPESFSFTSAANYLASLVSTKSEGRSLNEVKTNNGGNGKSPIHRNGKIYTGSYPREQWFNVLNAEQRKAVMEERERTGTLKKGKDKSNPKHKRQLKEIKRLKRQVSELRSAGTAETEADPSSSSDSEDSAPIGAGDSFGGRREKAKKGRDKKKNKKDK